MWYHFYFEVCINLIKKLIKTTQLLNWTVLVTVLLVLLAGNLLQVTLWAAIFLFSGESADFGTAFYHSLVNFTTLGYGDLVMSAERRNLGALEAANGVLMLGLATGILYWAISKLWQRKKEFMASLNKDYEGHHQVRGVEKQ